MIKDISKDLPIHESNEWDHRDEKVISTIVIHHSDTPAEFEIWNIATYHLRKGDPGIAYHFCVKRDGQAFLTSSMTNITHHVYGHNTPSVAICLVGSFGGNFGSKPPPDAQVDGVVQCTRYILDTLGKMTNLLNEKNGLAIVGHKEVPDNSTICPGTTWFEWKTNLLNRIFQDEQATPKRVWQHAIQCRGNPQSALFKYAVENSVSVGFIIDGKEDTVEDENGIDWVTLRCSQAILSCRAGHWDKVFVSREP